MTATSTEPMTLDHVRAILSLLTALDTRMASPDESTAKLRANAWHKILVDVDPEWALSYAQAAYALPRDYVMQVGEIREAWRIHTREDTRDDQVVEHRTAPGRADPKAAADYMRAIRETIANGGHWSQVERPAEAVREFDTAADERERRCTYWQLCACSHSGCRDGWSDVPVPVTNALGLLYEGAARCPTCSDALTMAEERGIAQKPAHARAGRRRV